MKQYIDKAEVIAEIERRKNQFVSQAEAFRKIGMEDKESYYAALASNMNSLSCFLDTLEVKENDLVEEIDYDDYMTFFKEHPDYIDGSWGFEETWTFAQYCYELGLKAQK